MKYILDLPRSAEEITSWSLIYSGITGDFFSHCVALNRDQYEDDGSMSIRMFLETRKNILNSIKDWLEFIANNHTDLYRVEMTGLTKRVFVANIFIVSYHRKGSKYTAA